MILKIALTGGPGAGKTKALPYVNEFAKSHGWETIIIEEVATQMILEGHTPGNTAFQTELARRQVEYEKKAQLQAQNMQSNVLIICDRGILDGKAYCTDEAFDKIMEDVDGESVNNYTAIFHLITPPEFYTLETNKARFENLNQAMVLDERTHAIWSGHPCVRIIEPKISFEEKMASLLFELAKVLH